MIIIERIKKQVSRFERTGKLPREHDLRRGTGQDGEFPPDPIIPEPIIRIDPRAEILWSNWPEFKKKLTREELDFLDGLKQFIGNVSSASRFFGITKSKGFRTWRSIQKKASQTIKEGGI